MLTAHVHRYNDVRQLPEPTDRRVGQHGVALRYAAAVRFSGWPLDHEVVAAEQSLRAALIRDGLRPAPGKDMQDEQRDCKLMRFGRMDPASAEFKFRKPEEVEGM